MQIPVFKFTSSLCNSQVCSDLQATQTSFIFPCREVAQYLKKSQNNVEDKKKTSFILDKAQKIPKRRKNDFSYREKRGGLVLSTNQQKLFYSQGSAPCLVFSEKQKLSCIQKILYVLIKGNKRDKGVLAKADSGLPCSREEQSFLDLSPHRLTQTRYSTGPKISI